MHTLPALTSLTKASETPRHERDVHVCRREPTSTASLIALLTSPAWTRSQYSAASSKMIREEPRWCMIERGF